MGIVTEEKGSFTAIGIAALRAVGARERDPAVQNPDYLAVDLLPTGLHIMVKLRPLARVLLKKHHRILPGAYYFHTARTKHIDMVLQQCAGLSQCRAGILEILCDEMNGREQWLCPISEHAAVSPGGEQHARSPSC